MNSQKYLDLLDELYSLHITKSAGYSGADNPDPWANFRTSTDFGVPPSVGALIRLSDKFQRVKSLLKNPENDKVGESIIDTAMDMAAYSLIFICLYNEEHADESVRPSSIVAGVQEAEQTRTAWGLSPTTSSSGTVFPGQLGGVLGQTPLDYYHGQQPDRTGGASPDDSGDAGSSGSGDQDSSTP